jgi:hypothetical protein
MLAELPTATDIDCLLTISGHGAFSFKVVASDPGANRDTIKQGNLVAIRGAHAYIGIIGRIEEEHGVLEVSGDSWASLLYERRIPLGVSYSNHAAGIIALQALQLVNSHNPTGFLPSLRNEPCGPFRGTFQAGGTYLGDALDDLADKVGQEWWLEQIVGRNSLQGFLHWGMRRGGDLSGSIHLTDGIHFTSSKYVQDILGTAQSVQMVGGGADIANRPSATQSTTFQGPTLSREKVEYLPSDEELAVLSDAAQAALVNPLVAAESLPLTINTKLDWRLIRPGDIITVILPDTYFGCVRRRVRILAMQPDEAAGEMDLAVKVWT